MTPHEELLAHEKLCAERYSTIHKRLDRIETMLNKLVWGAMGGFGAICVAVIISNIHLWKK
jgi:hypothetical protein